MYAYHPKYTYHVLIIYISLNYHSYHILILKHMPLQTRYTQIVLCPFFLEWLLSSILIWRFLEWQTVHIDELNSKCDIAIGFALQCDMCNQYQTFSISFTVRGLDMFKDNTYISSQTTSKEQKLFPVVSGYLLCLKRKVHTFLFGLFLQLQIDLISRYYICSWCRWCDQWPGILWAGH